MTEQQLQEREYDPLSALLPNQTHAELHGLRSAARDMRKMKGDAVLIRLFNGEEAGAADALVELSTALLEEVVCSFNVSPPTVEKVMRYLL